MSDGSAGSAPIQASHRPPAAPSPASDAATAHPSPPAAERAAERDEVASSQAGPSSQGKKDGDMARLLFQWAENNMPIPDEG